MMKVLSMVVIQLNQALTIESPPRLRQTSSSTAPECYSNTNGLIYNCPKTDICTSSYLFCPYASETCSSATPFKCDNNSCVSSPAKECCDADQFWCPHSQECVFDEADCCSLDPLTPIFCEES